MRRSRKVFRARLGVAVFLAIAFVSMTVFAQTVSKSVTSTSTTSTDLQRGKETFQHLCTACHGGRGDGKGPAASALTPRPTDLTRLAQRTGTSPTELVKAALKGTDPVVAHGSSGMMVWGAFFLADANGNQVTADAHIQDLAAFIESIQVKSRAATPAANRARP